MTVPLLVVESRSIGERRDDPNPPEESAEIRRVVRHVDRTRRHGDDGRGRRVPGAPEPLVVLSADRGGQSRTSPEFVDRARLAVVGGEDHPVRTFTRRQGVPHVLH